ncbi:helix-turn-helix domain-containing protein [Sulfitobacter sp. DFL-23]|uniref:Helix-turn-helix domain protein n=2 Tax=Pseudosulfitobacter pseudonitzschiae TaxID=1402135 RepID=A0A221K1R8_9RHOB|nr:helix-turn-helix domain-containing protein [Sulfitobacter sp. DFL-23]ASM72935.1 helix-turn-helix domain protein [Pseudosulfitobacter pseudonitzschiae]
MSGMALIWAANVKGLKPAAKIVLIQLADFHNKETGQCNPSAQRLADECEMGRATLFRHMATLEDCGLVTRHARGDGDGGRGANQYELHLDITLGPSARSKGGGSGQNGVASQNETGGNVSKTRRKSLKAETGVVPNRDTNLTIEPTIEPPTRERVVAEGEVAEKVLAAYPPDRVRRKAESLRWIREALDAGTEVEDLLQAVKAYATESSGFTRSKVCFSDNWFKSGRWHAYIEDIARSREETKARQAEALAGLADWVTDQHPLCRHITPGQVDALLAAKLVTQAQIQAAGLRS